MNIDGKAYHVYTLHVAESDKEIVGADPRSLDEIQADWLAKWKISAQRAAARDRSLALAQLKNAKVGIKLERAIDKEDDAYTKADEDSTDVLSPDQVAPPPAEFYEADEMLRLSGTPSGYGAVSIAAADVYSIQRSWGDDLVIFERTAPKKKARRKT